MKKQFLRVKQIADQTFLRAEKTEVLTEDLLAAERRVESIKVTCQSIHKKITSCQIDFGSETSLEKRLKKIPQVNLGATMMESKSSFSKNSALGDTLKECSAVQINLGTELLEYYNEVEKLILKPITGILENEIHNINKLRKQLGKLVLDMDSARTRFQTAERHSLQASCNNNLNMVGKVDTLKEELEDASQKVEQCRDTLAAEMFSLISKESQLAHLFVQFHQLQATYHRNALSALESSLPSLESLISDFSQKPVYGCSLEEHLRVTNRDIAQVIETCISFLMDYGILEEGLFRIGGSSTKLKKIKSAFDAGIDIDLTEFIRDPHAVSGALKSYLRELPEPLMTSSLYNDWLNAIKVQDSDAKLQALWQVMHKLPDANLKNLRFVIKFLSKVQENSDVNKMSSQNIAIVMAPNLIWSPYEESSSLGMNVSTTSLHTSIIDLLISYAEWFFPDEEEQINESIISNLNNIKRSKSLENETYENISEVNGNNLQALNNNSLQSSPHTYHKSVKKPAAPPPPADKSTVVNLIDLLNDTQALDELNSKSNEQPVIEIKEQTMSSAFIAVELQQNSPSSNTNKGEKPAIPDKPGFTSLSLDRKSLRQSSCRSSRGVNRASDIIPRNHVERPSVPPPERPIKPPNFFSSENIFTTEEEQKLAKNSEPSGLTSCQPLNNEATEATVPAINVIKNSECKNALQHSRSFTKGNRFDFLVNQKDDKPPERPPRTVGIADYNVKSDSVNVIQEPSSPNLSPAILPKTCEVEKIKPARPQPPAKPKFNMQNENTNL